MRGLRVIFSTSLRRCEKYDFGQPSNVFPMFFDFEGLDFGAESVYFEVVFSKALCRGMFFQFWVPFGIHLACLSECLGTLKMEPER